MILTEFLVDLHIRGSREISPASSYNIESTDSLLYGRPIGVRVFLVIIQTCF